MEDKEKVKCEEKSTVQFQCSLCSKIYPKQADLEIHIKQKHERVEKIQNEKQKEKEKEKQKDKDKEKEKEKQPTKPKHFKVQPRNRVLEMQQNDHEDTIYSYLGQLGERHQQNSSRDDLLLVDENQRQSIQTNYSFNKVVRTPYEKQLITVNLIPKQWIQLTPHKQLMEKFASQMTQLYNSLEVQKEKWEFRDPMAPEEEAQDQFSLMQIRKLILNYPKRKLNLKYPHLSIFLLWIGRICKPQAWQQFFIIISSYLAEYYSKTYSGKPDEKWNIFHSQFQKQTVKSYITEKLSICDEKTVKKLCEYFKRWTELFELVNDFC